MTYQRAVLTVIFSTLVSVLVFCSLFQLPLEFIKAPLESEHEIAKEEVDEFYREDSTSDVKAFEKVLTGKVTISEDTDPDHPNYLDPWYCEVDCEFGVPCTYRDEVDFRIIVMTYERAESLTKCLDKIKALDTMGARVSVDIWIDRSPRGDINNETLLVAEDAAQGWDKGRICVHQQQENAYIGGQWRNTWRPQPNTREIGLILEDDIDISPHTYKYLKAVSNKYGDRDDISGYTLQMHDVNFFGIGYVHPMKAPASETAFLYGVLGTWGFSPRPQAWRDFQDWFQSKNDTLKPLVPGIKPTNWYMRFERNNRAASMWEMWHIYHTNITDTYCVYCNLVEHTGRQDVLLSVNRKENGLHFKGDGSSENDPYLLQDWKTSFVDFPDDIIKYDYNGEPMQDF